MDETEIARIERRAQAAELALYDATHVLNRRIFETTLDLILVTDKRGSFIRVSPSALSILGYVPDEMIGHSAAEFLYSEDLDATRNEMRQARRSGTPRNFECRYVHKEGRIVTLWWTGVWSEIGENYFFIGRDVTDREEAARRVRESEARLALAVEIAQIGIASAEPPSEPTRTDALFNSIYGRPPETPTMSAGEWLRLVHPEDRDRAAAELLAVIRGGGLFTGDFRIRRGDTQEERWVRTVTRVDLDAGGEPSRFLGVHTDITDHKRALTTVIDREALLALAMRLVGMGMAIAETADELAQTDSQFRAIYGLPADKAEISVGEWLQLLHPDDRDPTAIALLSAIKGNEPYTGEFRFRRADSGEERWARALLQTATNAEGRYGRSLSVHLDITEQRQIEEQLRQAQKMEALGNLTGGMAHDFNNMLGVIIANLDLAAEEVEGNESAAELLKEATDAALSAAELTRRLLAFARRQPLRPEPIDINALVANLAQLLRRVLGEDVEIALDLADDLWTVVADAAQLESSLTNLAANARDAMPKGGRLLISTLNGQLDAAYAERHAEVAPGDYAVIAVTDSGTGMTPDVLERIFEPFFTTKEVGKGTGLGLSMVFGFIKQSGGHINVYSEPGIGTTFRLYLPRAAAADGSAAEVQAPAARRGTGQRVLVVEDNPRLRLAVVRQLRDLGYEPIETEGPRAAIEVLEHQAVDILFTDIVMPGPMDGIGLTQLVIERWPNIKVVLTSGFPGRTADERLRQQGSGIPLLSKPYRVEDLARVLRDVLDG